MWFDLSMDLYLYIRADSFSDTITLALADYYQHLQLFDLFQILFISSVMGKY